MDIGRLYGRYLPLTPGQTPAARSDSGRKFFGGENLTINRTNAYASSGRPKLTDDEIDALAVKYDFQNMTREDYDDFLDDLVDKGVLTKAETAYFGYGGTVRLDAADSKIMVVSVAGQERSYGQNTPFLRDGVHGNGDMVAWLAEMMESTDYSADPDAFQRVKQRCEMYGAIYDAVARATNSAAYKAGDKETPSIIDQLRDPNGQFYQDMFLRLKIQMEKSKEEQEKQAIIDALDAILESLSAKKDDDPPKKTTVRSMAELAETIDSLDKDDPRKAQLTLLKDRLQRLGIYADLDVGVKDEDETWETLTESLIREDAEKPNLSDII